MNKNLISRLLYCAAASTTILPFVFQVGFAEPVFKNPLREGGNRVVQPANPANAGATEESGDWYYSKVKDAKDLFSGWKKGSKWDKTGLLYPFAAPLAQKAVPAITDRDTRTAGYLWNPPVLVTMGAMMVISKDKDLALQVGDCTDSVTSLVTKVPFSALRGGTQDIFKDVQKDCGPLFGFASEEPRKAPSKVIIREVTAHPPEEKLKVYRAKNGGIYSIAGDYETTKPRSSNTLSGSENTSARRTNWTSGSDNNVTSNTPTITQNSGSYSAPERGGSRQDLKENANSNIGSQQAQQAVGNIGAPNDLAPPTAQNLPKESVPQSPANNNVSKEAAQQSAPSNKTQNETAQQSAQNNKIQNEVAQQSAQDSNVQNETAPRPSDTPGKQPAQTNKVQNTPEQQSAQNNNAQSNTSQQSTQQNSAQNQPTQGDGQKSLAQNPRTDQPKENQTDETSSAKQADSQPSPTADSSNSDTSAQEAAPQPQQTSSSTSDPNTQAGAEAADATGSTITEPSTASTPATDTTQISSTPESAAPSTDVDMSDLDAAVDAAFDKTALSMKNDFSLFEKTTNANGMDNALLGGVAMSRQAQSEMRLMSDQTIAKNFQSLQAGLALGAVLMATQTAIYIAANQNPKQVEDDLPAAQPGQAYVMKPAPSSSSSSTGGASAGPKYQPVKQSRYVIKYKCNFKGVVHDSMKQCSQPQMGYIQIPVRVE